MYRGMGRAYTWLTSVVGLASLLFGPIPDRVWAQANGESQPPWSFRSRVVFTANSHESEPAGFEVHSAIALEVALHRRIARSFATELTVHTESREVEFTGGPGPTQRLGSLELLPVSFLVQFHPWGDAKVRPYAGAGFNLTVGWEKSGVLDSMDVSPHVGPAVQAGADLDLSRSVLLNFDLRWNTLTTDLSADGVQYARLKIRPLTIGMGLGFRF
jgi:outer membrane protein